jgi:preprotein translocase subunit SecA
MRFLIMVMNQSHCNCFDRSDSFFSAVFMSRNHQPAAASLLRPGITDGYYPERSVDPPSWLERLAHHCLGFAKSTSRGAWKFHKSIAAIERHGKPLKNLSEARLAETARNLRVKLHQKGLAEDLIHQSFALIREAAGRTISMRHFDNQLMGGWHMLHGHLVEMETGEGKTLTATLAAATAALAGIPVHVVTVNDYLVARDVELMGPVYRALGLRVSAVTSDMDEGKRRVGYASDIAYCTNKQLAFDYLRDRILLGNDQGRLRLQLERLHDQNARTGRLFLRGLCFAIIDEADSVLVDEARTPLIISRKKDNSEENQVYHQAVSLAAKLQENLHFSVDLNERQVNISEKGSGRLADLTGSLGSVWKSSRQREELVRQALCAQHLYIRDHHYLVQDDKVMIIDENTGRVMADRSWERGLHQMIEIKEGCELTGQQEHLARMTYQRFFRRYLRLAGMTGTACEVQRELWSVYHLAVKRVPTHKPLQRQQIGHAVYIDKSKKWAAVVERIHELNDQQRPVLVGTRSVEDSELLSNLLLETGLEHHVLNARQDSREAETIARAGQKGGITVATNMAGRGTDIPLAAGVAEIGGLHVISTERNEARRIDRQLFGRCGRQGDPGSYESLLCLEDEIMLHSLRGPVQSILKGLLKGNGRRGQKIALRAMRFAQYSRERKYLRMRRDLLQMDEQLGRMLAFSGKME